MQASALGYVDSCKHSFKRHSIKNINYGIQNPLYAPQMLHICAFYNMINLTHGWYPHMDGFFSACKKPFDP